ncbi:MAG: hypothetical protein IH945_14145, partial [Armatimonadetes bacterium]|nr:hypothetical protein [Armatimonadota bacterium]
MSNPKQLKPSEQSAREYADRLILQQLTELYEVMKPSEISDRLKGTGLGLPVVRSLLASNPRMFAYSERRWIPAARVAGSSRSFHEAVRLVVERYNAPMPLSLCVQEISRSRGRAAEWVEAAVRRIAIHNEYIFLTKHDDLVPANIVFRAADETFERAFELNGVDANKVTELEKKLGRFNWLQDDAIMLALEKCAPVSVKVLAAAAWKKLSPQDPTAHRLYDWRAFNAELLSIPGFVYAPDGRLHAE